MTDNKLADNTTASAGQAQERRVLQAPVDSASYEEIVGSFRHLGALNASSAASQRLILLAYARSKKVRRAVREALALVADGGHEADDADSPSAA